jgi:hypothetical protein
MPELFDAKHHISVKAGKDTADLCKTPDKTCEVDNFYIFPPV